MTTDLTYSYYVQITENQILGQHIPHLQHLISIYMCESNCMRQMQTIIYSEDQKSTALIVSILHSISTLHINDLSQVFSNHATE